MAPLARPLNPPLNDVSFIRLVIQGYLHNGRNYR